MLKSSAFYNTLLASDAALLALLGPGGKILNAWPQLVTAFPCVIFQDVNQADREFGDNAPTMSELRVQVDIFTKDAAGAPKSSDLGIAVANVFAKEFFYCPSNGEVPDDTVGVRHRRMVFTRAVSASDLV